MDLQQSHMLEMVLSRVHPHLSPGGSREMEWREMGETSYCSYRESWQRLEGRRPVIWDPGASGHRREGSRLIIALDQADSSQMFLGQARYSIMTSFQ
jgi:hypothetical protein